MQWYNYDNSTDRYTELFTGLNIMREKKEGISMSLKIIRSNSEDIGAEVFVEAEQKLLSPDISEDKIRSFYKDHLLEAKKNSSSSIAFPLVPFGLEYACEEEITAMCLCVGARLNLDETKDLLARAGYALSPCDKTDIIFSYFIENEIYDMIELDIKLEEYGLPCLIA